MILKPHKRVKLRHVIAIVVSVLLLIGMMLGPAGVDRQLNQVSNLPPYHVSPEAQSLHQRLVIADLHADFLLWKRDLLQGYSRGHLDLPRLQKGNMALQVFSVVTQSSWGQNYEHNRGDSDRITLLALAQAWPPRTWFSLHRRALYQARRLDRATSGGSLMVIRTSDDLDRLLNARSAGSRVVGAMLAIEGLHALEGRIENVDSFYEAGFRMMAPVHMFDNDLGGSAHGVEGGGLTEFGRQVIRRMEALHIIVDLAHASARTIDDVLRVTTRPVVVSHTGIRATCESPRNLSDDQIRRIVAAGGVIGIGFWDRAVCGTNVSDIVRAIRHAADIGGVEHVALGSDFDGTVLTAFDAQGMALLTGGLLESGFSEDEIAGIMGGNVIRLLRDTLPF